MIPKLLGFIAGVAIASRIIFIQIRKRRMTITEPQVINEVLFFPDREYACVAISKSLSSGDIPTVPLQEICRNPCCVKLHGRDHEPPSSMLKFLNYLASARRSVDLCIYVFTQSSLAGVLRHLHKSNVSVRIITDTIEDDATGNQIDNLRTLGIKVKSNRRGTGTLMHHKFVIIDKKILMSGSFNWTNKAIVSNFEAVMITSASELVDPFVREFESLWGRF